MHKRYTCIFCLLVLAAASCGPSDEQQRYEYTNGIGSPPPRNSGEMDFQVHKLQSDLKSMGYDPGPCDGIIGPRTESAIASLQEDNPLLSDRISEKEVRSAIFMQKTRMCGTEYSVPAYCGKTRNGGIYPADIPFNPYIKGRQIQYGGVSALGDRPLTSFAISRYRSAAR